MQRLHLWLGLSVGLVYALIALSGSVLAFQQPWLRAAYPQLAAHALPDATQRAAVLARIADEWQPRGLRAADLPLADLPVWQLYFRDGTRRYLDPIDGSLLLTRSRNGDALQFLHYWHTHLLAGKRGEQVLGVIGGLALFLLVSGPLLWWPGRRHLLASLRPHAQPPTRRWASWHRGAGILSLPLLVLLSLTGTLMIYGAGTARLLRSAFGDPAKTPAPAALAQFVFVAIAFMALAECYVASDFSVLNVYENSNSAMPLIYRLTSIWGNHEGSMMLWVSILAFFGALVALFGTNLPVTLKANALAVQAWIAAAFQLFILTTSNPFLRIADAPFEGRDLNPVLQDPGLAFHPPLLYLGYVGFSIAFSFAIWAAVSFCRKLSGIQTANTMTTNTIR